MRQLPNVAASERRYDSPHEYPNNADISETLYLATLSRRPSPDERKLAEAHVAGLPDRTEALRDIQHALINSNEFLLRH